MPSRITMFLSLVLVAMSAGVSQAATWDLKSDMWVASDALGRELPGYADCGAPSQNKTVSIFYLTWHAKHVQVGPYNISDIMDANPNALQYPSDPAWGTDTSMHWWNEPELGYYKSDDLYVIRKHCEMLIQAGVDLLVFDVTNSMYQPGVPANQWYYLDEWTAICNTLTTLRNQGRKVPKICFYARYCEENLPNYQLGQHMLRLYNDIYNPSVGDPLFQDFWFYLDGDTKPLFLLYSAWSADPEPPQYLKDFFTIREMSHRVNKVNTWFGTGQDKWLWHDDSPQDYGWHVNPSTPEQTSVSVAMQECYMTAGYPNNMTARGRHYSNGTNPPPSQWDGSGDYFEEQWTGALNIDPPYIFIMEWNEWIAQKLISTGGCGVTSGWVYFVDLFTQEYSRDVEPMKNGHTDNYYYQMVDGIRRYKGVRAKELATEPTTIVIDGSFDDWMGVGPEYRDSIGDTLDRNHAGYAGTGPYVKTSGRNDIVASKVANDASYVYVYARTADDLTSYTDPDWMLLYIDIDANHSTGWQGYDRLVNATVSSSTQTIMNSWSGSAWTGSTALSYRATGNELEIRIPRSSLGLGSGLTGTFTFDFHWADNISSLTDITTFFKDGDSAPDRRFNYRYIRAVDLFIDQGTSPENAFGLTRVGETPTYQGETVVVNIGGRNARHSDTGSAYFYFDADDAYVQNGNIPDLYITVDYFDASSDSGYFWLQYDSSDWDAGPTGDGAYKSGGVVWLTQTDTWKQHTFHLTDAWFAGRQNDDADFRFTKSGGMYLDVVSVVNAAPAPARTTGTSPSGPTACVDINADLSWDWAPRAASYDVYFGTSSTPTFQQNQTTTTFDPGTLNLGMTYYWRVDTVGEHGTTTGELCWFATTPAQPSTPTSTSYCGYTRLTRGTPPAGVTWYWQTASGGTSTANSATNWDVTSSGTYYLRARGNDPPNCWSDSASKTVTVTPVPNTPTNGLANPSSICSGASSDLTASVAGAVIDWYTGSCGGTLVYTGSLYNVSPATTTTYYARARDTSSSCESTGCDTVTVTLLSTPTATATAIPGQGAGTVRISSNLSGTQTFYLRDSGCAPIDAWTGNATEHDFTGLPDGTYRGQVAKDSCLSACSAPVTLNSAFPDFDGDGDVDQEDFGHFQSCLTGEGVIQIDPNCQDAKLDGDNDVDAADFAVFEGCMGGPNTPPAC